MKRFYVVLLALGLITAFSLPVYAVDLTLSGDWYTRSWYVSNVNMATGPGYSANNSEALLETRTRLAPHLTISEGLYFDMRLDALENVWGDRSWGTSPGNTLGYSQTGMRVQSPQGQQILAQQNIEIQRAWVTAVTPIGALLVGYQPFSRWGTSFGDSDMSVPGVTYAAESGPLTFIAQWGRYIEGQNDTFGGTVGGTGVPAVNAVDSDYDEYQVGAIYKFTGGETGLALQYIRIATTRAYPMLLGITSPSNPNDANYDATQYVYGFDPYFKYTLGPLYIEGEFLYGLGKYADFENNSVVGKDIDVNTMDAYLNAKVNVGPAYVGGMFAYAEGNDPDRPNMLSGGVSKWLQLGSDFSPCLILWNSDYTNIVGSLKGAIPLIPGIDVPAANGSFIPTSPYSHMVDAYFDNAWLYQFYAGVKPIPKLELKGIFSYAYADEKPTLLEWMPQSASNPKFVGKNYGEELDITATYMIFKNLSFMLGGGYLWTGDYFKGTDPSATVQNNYLITSKLALNF
jgi:hypothetical protein